jgi:hypothetical protein
MFDADGGSDARWAKAAARAEDVTDLGIEDAVRRYYLVHLPTIVLIAMGIAFVFASLWPPAPGSVLVAGVAFGLMLGGLASSLAGLVYASKKIGPKVQPRRVGVTIGLTADEAKRVRRQIFGKTRVYDDLRVLRAAAVQTREGLGRQLVTSPPLLLLFLGQALSRGVASPLDVIMLAALLVIVVALVFLVREFRQTGAFLTTTATSASDDRR